MRLSMELVPRPLWGKSLARMSKNWDAIRRQVYKNAKFSCEVCGNDDAALEAHEIWEYDDVKHVQKLVGFICLCHYCHEVKHFGLAQTQGRGDVVWDYYMKVNQLTEALAFKIDKEMNKCWQERSGHQWIQDLSYEQEFLRRVGA